MSKRFKSNSDYLRGLPITVSLFSGPYGGNRHQPVLQGDKPRSFERVILSVKAGKTDAAHVKDLKGVLERKKAVIGAVISIQEATSPHEKGSGYGEVLIFKIVRQQVNFLLVGLP